MSKKVLSLVLALVMVLGSFSFVSAAKYDDVTGTTYEEAVDRLSLLGILEGYPDGKFLPDGEITRAEFAAVAIRAKGLKATAEAAQGLPTGFTDVPGTFWASGIIGTAGKLGIVNGVGNGLFAPQAPVKYEEAITMLVRALGYEPSAQAKGGYPYGYFIVANEVGLLDAVKGTQGAPATRGQVAQMTDNALETEMMIQVGYGTDTKWVVSGTENTTEKYLLDELGFDSVIGRPTSVNNNRKGITVTVEDEDEIKRLGLGKKETVSISIPEGFDIYAIEGLESKVWYRDDIVIAKALEEAKYDAFEYNEDDEELDLITEDESYEIADSKDLYDITIDDNKFKDLKNDDPADYAKVVLNDDDEVIWAQGYTFDGFIVVDEVKDEVVYSADDYDDVDVEDYLIVKEGKEISVADLEEGDVLYYNDDEEFAVVSNKSITGEIERVYTSNNQVKFAGKTYDIADNAIYLTEDGKIDDLDADILDELKNDEEEVTMFFNFRNEVVLALAGDVKGSSDYYVITGNSNAYKGRGDWMVSLDVRNSAGEKVALDLDVDFVDPKEDGDLKVQDKFDGSKSAYKAKSVDDDKYMEELAGELAKGKVVEITLDKDGDPTEVVIMNGKYLGDNSKVETDDSKVKVSGYDYKLKSNSVIFYDSTKKAILFGAAEEKFDQVEEPTLYAYDGNIVAIVGDTDTDTSTVSGVLKKVSNVKLDKDGYIEFKLDVNGKATTYVTEDDDYDLPSVEKGYVIDLEVSDSTGEVDSFSFAKDNADRFVTGKITAVNGKNITLEAGEETLKFELISGGVAYNDKIESVRPATLEGEEVTLYRDGTHARYVQYIIKGAIEAVEPTPVDPEPVTFTGVKASGEVTKKGVTPVEAVETPVDEVKAEAIVDTDINLVSKLTGILGNDISIEIVAQEDADKELVIAVTGKAIKVGLATDFAKDISSTKKDVVDAINGDSKASALVTASIDENEDEIAVAVTKTLLTGGVDEVKVSPGVTGVEEVYTLTITSGATNAGGVITVKGADSDIDVNVTKGMTAEEVATAISEAGLNADGYDITVEGDKVVFTATEKEAKDTSLNIKVVDKSVNIE